jgi:hypothetical protein
VPAAVRTSALSFLSRSFNRIEAELLYSPTTTSFRDPATRSISYKRALSLLKVMIQDPRCCPAEGSACRKLISTCSISSRMSPIRVVPSWSNAG